MKRRRKDAWIGRMLEELTNPISLSLLEDETPLLFPLEWGGSEVDVPFGRLHLYALEQIQKIDGE